MTLVLHSFGHHGLDSARHQRTCNILLLERESRIQTNTPIFWQFLRRSIIFFPRWRVEATHICIRPDSSLPIRRSQFVGYYTAQRSVFVVHVYELHFSFSVYFESHPLASQSRKRPRDLPSSNQVGREFTMKYPLLTKLSQNLIGKWERMN